MHQQLTTLLLTAFLVLSTRNCNCTQFECTRRTPDAEQTDATLTDADAAPPTHRWDVHHLRSVVGLRDLGDLSTLARSVTPPEWWAEDEKEPKPNLVVTCVSVGEDRGGGGARQAEALGGRGAVWADVVDASAIPAISELIPRMTRLRIRRLADAEILSPLVADARVLRQLNLASASSSLGKLPPTWLMGAKYRLSRLDASRCGITGISEGAFKGAPLRWLSLAGNRITRLRSEALADLAGLWHLDLSRNAMAEIAEGAFASLKELRSLDLSFNGFTRPSLSSVAPLALLAVLSVGNNALGGEGPIPVAAKLQVLLANNAGLDDGDLDLKNATELRVLHVSGNGLTRLQSLPRLQELNASANQLVTLAVWPELLSLDASRNAGLGDLCSSVADKSAPKLRLLIVDGVEKSYSEGVFLKQCNLSSSLVALSAGSVPNLETLPSGAFASLRTENRLFLRISNNTNLKHIEEHALGGLRFQALDLSHNALSGLSPGTASWSDVASVDLQGNPWRCECNLQWMLDELLPDLYRWTPELLDDVRCASPPHLRGARFVHWFNHSEGVFCGEVQRLLLRGQRRAVDGEVLLEMSPGALGVVVAAGVVAVLLVGLGIAAHHRYVRRRRVRNRRL